MTAAAAALRTSESALGANGLSAAQAIAKAFNEINYLESGSREAALPLRNDAMCC